VAGLAEPAVKPDQEIHCCTSFGYDVHCLEPAEQIVRESACVAVQPGLSSAGTVVAVVGSHFAQAAQEPQQPVTTDCRMACSRGFLRRVTGFYQALLCSQGGYQEPAYLEEGA